MMVAPVILFAPLAAFALIALLPPLRNAGKLAAVVSIAGVSVAFTASVMSLAYGFVDLYTFPWMVVADYPIAHIGWQIDAVSRPMAVVVTGVAACVQVYSYGYLGDEPKPALGRYYAWQSLFVFAMMTLVFAPNLLQLVIGWELVGLCSYLLIGYWWQRPSAAKAAVKAVWITRLADIGLLSGLVLLYVETGDFSWEAQASALVAGLLFLGVMGKSAQVPLHVWLPDAMEGPTPVSALLHAATMVAAGVYMIVRTFPLFQGAPLVLDAMSWIGAVTALSAAVMALGQDDIKKVLAYSTCSQLGYMVAGLGSGEMLGGYFHLTTHAGFKALLFLAAGSVIHAVHTNSISQMGGLSKHMRVTTALWCIGALALAGVPLFAGFFSKDLILEELVHAGKFGPVILLVVGAGVTGLYNGRVIAQVFFGETKGHPHESGPVMLTPMLALALPAIALGFFGAYLAVPLGLEYHFAVTPVGIAASLFALGGLAVGYTRKVTVPLPSFIDDAYTRGWNQGLLPGARVVGWLDRYVVDALINLTGWLGLAGADRLRRWQTGQVRDYAFAVAVGVVVLAGVAGLQ